MIRRDPGPVLSFGLPTTPTRYLLGVLVPGVVATAPWIALVEGEWRVVFDEPVSSVLMSAIVAVVGGVLEVVSSSIEVTFDNSHKQAVVLEDDWYAYLCRRDDKRAVMYGYISRLVDAMYFELAMAIAAPFSSIGLAILLWRRLDSLWGLIGMCFGFAANQWFLKQARCTHGVLFRARREFAKSGFEERLKGV